MLTRERREIGRYSEGEAEGEEVLGMGTTTEFFQSAGNIPDEREELKISERGEHID